MSLPKTSAGQFEPQSTNKCNADATVLSFPHIAGLKGIENETRPDGSLPRKAHPMDEKACCWLEN